MFSNPRRHLVIVVGDVIFGYVVGGRVPDAVVAENIAQRLVEMLRGIGAPDIVRMQRQTHDTPVFRTFSVERVELVLDGAPSGVRWWRRRRTARRTTRATTD